MANSHCCVSVGDQWVRFGEAVPPQRISSVSTCGSRSWTRNRSPRICALRCGCAAVCCRGRDARKLWTITSPGAQATASGLSRRKECTGPALAICVRTVRGAPSVSTGRLPTERQADPGRCSACVALQQVPVGDPDSGHSCLPVRRFPLDPQQPRARVYRCRHGAGRQDPCLGGRGVSTREHLTTMAVVHRRGVHIPTLRLLATRQQRPTTLVADVFAGRHPDRAPLPTP